MHVYHWHKEGFELPDGAELLAVGPTFPNQAYRYGDKAYGIQFHPEVTGQVMARWCAEAAHMLEAPGAQDAERQVAAAKRFDAPMERWLDGFFDLWLGAEPNPRGQE
jgi:GMP synthase (glutamine-hydrolysing)